MHRHGERYLVNDSIQGRYGRYLKNWHYQYGVQVHDDRYLKEKEYDMQGHNGRYLWHGGLAVIWRQDIQYSNNDAGRYQKIL
jgi:hypothetical protein